MNLKILKIFNKYIFPILLGILIQMVLGYSGLIVYIICLFLLFCWKRRKKFFAYFGKISNIKGNQENSAKWFYRAYLVDKTDNLIATDAAYTLLRLGDLEKAKQILMGVDLETLTGEAKVKAANNISILYWKSGNLSEAISSLENMYNSNEKSTSLYGNLTFYYILDGNIEKALAFAIESFNYNSSDIVILENLARIYHLTGDLENAKANYDKLEKLGPTYPEAWYNIALFFEKTKEYEKAIKALNSALNCKFSFLSNVTKDQVETKLKNFSMVQFSELENLQNS